MNVDGIYRPVVAIKFDHPDIHFAINYTAARIAVAMHYLETGNILPTGTHIWTNWYSMPQPMDGDIEESLLSRFNSYSTLMQGKFNASDQFEVRFAVDQENPVSGFLSKFHSSFTTVAFCSPDGFEVPNGSEDAGRLFLIGADGIGPLDKEFPANVRLNVRKTQESQK